MAEDTTTKDPRAEAVFKTLASIRNIPTLPVVLQKLGKSVRDPRADARKIGRIIEDDPAMMVRILKVVNSAFYASVEPVTSIQHAVARMGMRAVNNIAMSTSVFSAFSKGDDNVFNRKEFWRHSISTGIASTVLYEKASAHIGKRFSKDLLHLAGLLHDIGRIVMDQYFHSDFARILRLSPETPLPSVEAEQSVLGVNHAAIGAWLGKQWNLTDDLLSVVQCHHAPASAPVGHSEIVALVHMANYICNTQKIGFSGDAAPSYDAGMWKQLGLTVADIPAVVDATLAEAAKSEILLSFV